MPDVTLAYVHKDKPRPYQVGVASCWERVAGLGIREHERVLDFVPLRGPACVIVCLLFCEQSFGALREK